MSTQPVLFPVLLAADTDPLVRAVAAYLARFKDATRVHTESDLRAFLTWCTERRRYGRSQMTPSSAAHNRVGCFNLG